MQIDYTPPFTCDQFMSSESFGRLIAGPIGSGKTTSCMFELFRRSAEQAPAADGFRYTRWAILRQTLKQLEDTVLKDILGWFKGIATYKVSTRTVHIEFGDIRSEWLLLPLEDPEDQRRLLSMQLTGAWISEAIELSVDLVAAISGRVGRYPSGVSGVPSWFGIICDTNMPSEGSDWHKFMEEPTSDWQIFIQPGGLTAFAENLEWLTQTEETLKLPLDHPARQAQGRTYYERAARNRNPDWVRRYVHAKYGDDPSGSAVFRESFIHSFHVVKRNPNDIRAALEPVGASPLVVGLDFGRDPCAAITQLDPMGRLLVLGEAIVEDMGLENMVRNVLRPLLMTPRYVGRPVVIIGDPAGAAKNNLYEITSFDLLKTLGFVAYPAPTNDIDPRIAAIDAFLLQQRGGRASFLVDGDHCPTIVRALGGGYRYAKTRAGVRKPTPDKNEFSHVMDGLQYAALAAHGGMSGLIARQLAKPRRGEGRKITVGGWT